MEAVIDIRIYHESCRVRSPHPNPAPLMCESEIKLNPPLKATALVCPMCHETITVETQEVAERVAESPVIYKNLGMVLSTEDQAVRAIMNPEKP